MFDPRTTREVADQVAALPAWQGTEQQQQQQQQQPGLELDTSQQRVYPTTSSDAEKQESYSNTPSDSATSIEEQQNEPQFIPITHEDRQMLSHLARTMSKRQSSTYSRGPSHDLNRVNTLEAIHEGDAELDPADKAFDLYKWLRLFIHNLDQEGIKRARAGIVFKNLGVSGSGAALQLQQTVAGLALEPFRALSSLAGKSHHKQIINNFNGFLKSGELLIVLGRPGSGCSTFLKTLCGETHGLSIDKGSTLHYNGVSRQQMMKEFKGEVVYNQEVDKHFPHLTVGQTLEFAAAARTPTHRLDGQSRNEYSKHIAQIFMAVFGLSHTYNTKVGDDFVRGVSGGERKRVSIAEMAVAAAPLAAWDNSTRGLDSATAFKFVQSLRTSANLGGSAHAVAIYQASQAIYDIFDKAIVLYEGRCIYFGRASKAKQFFEKMGFVCSQRQTTGDFLTSLTNPIERQAKAGMEDQVPRTSEDFERYWLESPDFKQLQHEIEQHENEFPEGELEGQLRGAKLERQAGHSRKKSPYTLSIPMQIKLNTKRAYQRVWGDITATASTVFIQIVMALIIGSIFYGHGNDTSSFQGKSATLFFAVLLNALIAVNEINSLYAQRPIVEKHNSYAFYHPATEAIAGIVSDVPVKFTLAVAFNIVLYFLSGLRYEPSQFFIFFLINFIIMFVMAAVFRTMAASTKTISQAMTLSGVLILALVIYTGFVLPVPYMHPWFNWIHYLNPIYYAFEILVANEFHGREFPCASFVPSGPGYPQVGNSFICSTTGAVAGSLTVSGDSYIGLSYEYYYSHVWRNFGILLAFLFGFLAIYFAAVEINSSTTSTAEVLVFRRGHVPKGIAGTRDEEAVEDKAAASEDNEQSVNAIPAQKDIFTWRDVVYDIQIKGEPRRLLDHVSGYVKPGTLTALMGVSGAGKTTLLDVLAQRTTMGVITGDMLVNGTPANASFQRNTGYVQQQDLHLQTATVRESLRFSAMLRQPKSVSKQEKYDYVEDVIKMLAMEDFAEAVVGVPGQGLNVEQRKLLTIGVELAAKPKLLLFLDEPTSGLDSQSAWAICAFLRKLANAGQAVLCTIHQPSAILFQEFDRLLFLAKGGKTVYFGPIGKNSRTLLDYFEGHGSRKCGDDENPAEFMLEIVNAGSSGKGQDWHEVWKSSDEVGQVQTQIDELHQEHSGREHSGAEDHDESSEFAMPLWTQIVVVTQRVFQQYWRMPEYVMAKWMLGTVAGLFIGFSFFNSDTSTQGLQNVIFSAFMLATIFSSLVQQIMPLFVTQRDLYEVRERPSKAYSWLAFMLAQIIVEIPYNVILGILVFATYYYPIEGIQTSLQQGQVLIFCIQFFIYAGTFAHFCIAALPNAETAAALVTLLFAMSLVFNGVMQTPSNLPGFWIFMYRASPFTYWVAGIVSAGLHGKPVDCNAAETSVFDPPGGQTCGAYMANYLTTAPGTLRNPSATAGCQYCSLSSADQFLAGSGIVYSQIWRNFGIFWVYVVFNIAAAIGLYYIFRVKKFSLASPFQKLGKANKKVSPKPQPLKNDAEGQKEKNTAQPY